MTIARIFYTGTLFLSGIMLTSAVLLGLRRRKDMQSRHRWLFIYLLFLFFIEVGIKTLAYLHLENLWVFPLYAFGEFLLLSVFFGICFGRGKPWYIFFGIGSVLILVEHLVLLKAGGNVSTGIGKPLSHLIVLVFCSIEMIRMLRRHNLILLQREWPLFAALFFYYSVSLFLFLFLDRLQSTPRHQALVIWGCNNLIASALYFVSARLFLTLPTIR